MKSFSFPEKLKTQILKAAKNQLLCFDVGRLHHDLGRFYAKCFNALPVSMKKNSVIGLHGQTVFHEGAVATLQIGESSYLAKAAQTLVVSDFRPMDMAVGGQGAPIATYFHEKVFGQNKKTVAVHNLGGISNFTLIKNNQTLKSFDTGPANILLDALITQYSKGKILFDRNGQLAKKGVVDSDCLNRLLKDPFFAKKPPKSCGREQFGAEFLNKFLKMHRSRKLNDQLATLTELTAVSMAHAYRDFTKVMPSEIILCGGGSKNLFLVSRIKAHLSDCKISVTEDYGWSAQAIEGAAFALLAVARILHQPNNRPATTGANGPVSMGKITSYVKL